MSSGWRAALTRIGLGPRTARDAARRAASDAYWEHQATGFASHYELNRTGLTGRLVRNFLEERARLLDGWLKVNAGDAILDVGCGHGIHLVRLAAQGAVTTGIDVSPAMLALARRRLVDAGLGEGTLIPGRLEHTTLRPVSFDLTLAIGLMDYVEDWRGALLRLTEATRPGGRLVFTIPKSPSPFFFLRAGPGLWVRRVLFDLPPVLSVATRREVEAGVAACGLELEALRSCQATMWAARCRRPG